MFAHWTVRKDDYDDEHVGYEPEYTYIHITDELQLPPLQQYAKLKAPVFELLRRRFEVFHPAGRNVVPMGVKFGVDESTPNFTNTVAYKEVV